LKKEKKYIDFPRIDRFVICHKKKDETCVIKDEKMTTGAVNTNSIVDPVWKDRIDRAFKHICRTIDIRQRRDIV
jgi:hypothetical protein